MTNSDTDAFQKARFDLSAMMAFQEPSIPTLENVDFYVKSMIQVMFLCMFDSKDGKSVINTRKKLEDLKNYVNQQTIYSGKVKYILDHECKK